MLIAKGATVSFAASSQGIKEQALLQWMHRAGALDEYREQLRDSALADYAAAMNVLREQLNSTNQWIRLGAAREIISHTAATATGEADRVVVVQVQGMPHIGMPLSLEQQEDAGYEEADNALARVRAMAAEGAIS